METIRLLEIEPTTRCNFTCAFCCGRTLPQVDLPVATFEAALAAFPEVQHLELQGEGEPLLHPQFFEMVAAARSRGIRVSLISNGSLLDERTVELILDGGFEKLLVSVESADAATFRQIRGGDLGAVIKGLDRLVRGRRLRGLERPAIGLAVTVMRRTVSELPGIVALYQSLGLDGGIATQPLNPMPFYRGCYPPDLAGELLTAQELAAGVEEMRADLVGRAAIDGTSPVRGFFDELFDGFEVGGRVCPWLGKGVFVAADGWVTACCTIKDIKAYPLGRIGVDDPARIRQLRAEMVRDLREGILPRACAGCEIAAMAIDQRAPRGEGGPSEQVPAGAPQPAGETGAVSLSQPGLTPGCTVPGGSAAGRPTEEGRPPEDRAEAARGPDATRDRGVELEERCARLEQELDAARAEVRALRRSLSWRLTAPLRTCYEWLGLHRR